MARTSVSAPSTSKILMISSRNLRSCEFTGGAVIVTVAT
jgi:hypothetical protein